MINSILNFIHRRFPHDSNWLDGNCYFFALILIDRFPSLRMYYDPIEGHFVVSSDGETFFDWSGIRRYPDKKLPLSLETIEESEPQWYARIMKGCRY